MDGCSCNEPAAWSTSASWLVGLTGVHRSTCLSYFILQLPKVLAMPDWTPALIDLLIGAGLVPALEVPIIGICPVNEVSAFLQESTSSSCGVSLTLWLIKNIRKSMTGGWLYGEKD